jgi:hypothetical protein
MNEIFRGTNDECAKTLIAEWRKDEKYIERYCHESLKYARNYLI